MQRAEPRRPRRAVDRRDGIAAGVHGGFTLADGIWHLGRRTFFGGAPDPVTRREIFLVGGAAFDFNGTLEVGGAPAVRSRGSYATSGNIFSTTIMCPGVGSSAFPYRVMPDGTLLMQSGAEVRTYRRQCGTATLGGPVVPQTAGAGAAPTPAGGTIVDGVYHLTAVVKHGGGALSTGTRRQTIVFASAALHTVVFDSDAGFMMYQGTFSTSGATYNASVTCPFTGAAPPTNYTATATTFTQFANVNEYLGLHADVTRRWPRERVDEGSAVRAQTAPRAGDRALRARPLPTRRASPGQRRQAIAS